jgi:transposase-like protein
MSKYKDETRAAVMAALLTGQSVSSIAKQYDIPKGTVSNWKRNTSGTIKRTQKTEHIGELLIRYLQSNLEALSAQAEQFKDHDWLRKQTASDAAVLHGVMTDKAIRLLEALSKSSEHVTNDSDTDG